MTVGWGVGGGFHEKKAPKVRQSEESEDGEKRRRKDTKTWPSGVCLNVQ